MDYIVSSKALSFYLKAQITTLRDRLLLEKNSRPLISHLQTDDELTEFIGKHLFERLPFYGKASHTVSVDTGSPKELAQKIKDLI